MNIRIAVATAALAFSAGTALAGSGWEKINDTLSVDTASIQTKGDMTTASFRLSYDKPQVIPFINKQYDRSERSYEMYCKDGKALLLTNTLYLKDDVVSSFDSRNARNPFGGPVQTPQPTPVPEGSMESAALKYVCAKKAN